MALSATDWKCLSEVPSGCFSMDAGRGLVLVILVGRIPSSTDVGVDALLLGVDRCTVLMRFSCFFFGFESSVAGAAGVFAAGVAGFEDGGDARCDRVDSLRDRAGSTRLVGVSSATVMSLSDPHEDQLKFVPRMQSVVPSNNYNIGSNLIAAGTSKKVASTTP